MSDFYRNLKGQFECLRQAQIHLDACVDNVTSLMEQASHLFSDVADVPELVAEEGPAVPVDFYPFPPTVDEEAPPWPMPGSDVPSEAFVIGHDILPDIPIKVQYEGTVNQPSFGTVTYEQ